MTHPVKPGWISLHDVAVIFRRRMAGFDTLPRHHRLFIHEHGEKAYDAALAAKDRRLYPSGK